MLSTPKPLASPTTMVNFTIATVRLTEGRKARRHGWKDNMFLEPTTIGGKVVYGKAVYKPSGQRKELVLLTEADTQAVDWMIIH